MPGDIVDLAMREKDAEFEIPASLADAENLRRQLTEDIERIQIQLGDRDRTDELGRRLTSSEYWDWRKKAQHSLNRKLSELRSLKSWLKNARDEKPAKLEEAMLHLEQMLSIAKSRLGKKVKQEQQRKMDAAQKFLDRVQAGEANAD